MIPEADEWAVRRQTLVADLARKGIVDQRVLGAMGRVPRHRFVPEAERDRSYVDAPLPIGWGQTISQPYMVAAMAEALNLSGRETLLEVGTGCGYQAAILSRLSRRVVSLERVPELADRAGSRLAEMGYDNVTVSMADGTLGVVDDGPFDAILVTAGGPNLPPPLLNQLADGGKLVMPVGDRNTQTLMRYTKLGDEITEEALMACIFVPLIGAHGWRG